MLEDIVPFPCRSEAYFCHFFSLSCRNILWALRRQGKLGYRSPVRIQCFPRPVPSTNVVLTLTPLFALFVQEQFTREWEDILDSPDAQNARVAGQYSWKSNLWQLAMVSSPFYCLPIQCFFPWATTDKILGWSVTNPHTYCYFNNRSCSTL